MARVLLPSEAAWYDELKAVSYYVESDLEREIRQHVVSLFPDFYVFQFKKTVTSTTTGETNTPDLAMVRRDYGAWGIIEVEVIGHEIQHVLDQTACFTDGDYNAPDMADYIHRQINIQCQKHLILKRLQDLISNNLPTVLVIVDAHKEAWSTALRAKKIKLCVFQIFKNTQGRNLYHIFGDYPYVPVQEAHCRRHPQIPNLVEVVGNFEFKRLGKTNQVDIAFDDMLTRWTLIVNKRTQYLRFLGKINPVSSNATHTLQADRQHKYTLKITGA